MPEANPGRTAPGEPSGPGSPRDLGAEVDELRARLDAISAMPGQVRARSVEVVDRRGVTRVEMFVVDHEDEQGGDDTSGLSVRDRHGEPAATIYVTSSRADDPVDECVEVAFSNAGEMAYGMGLVGGRPSLWYLGDRRTDVASRLFGSDDSGARAFTCWSAEATPVEGSAGQEPSQSTNPQTDVSGTQQWSY